MSLSEVTLEGTLQADGSVVLDKKPNLPPGRVQVVMRTMSQLRSPENETLVAFVQRIHQESLVRKHRFMTEQEISSWIDDLRADDDRIERAYRESEDSGPKAEQP